jgi:sulfate/thiosulfate transport system permease protein
MPDGVFGEGRLVRWTLIALAVGFLVLFLVLPLLAVFVEALRRGAAAFFASFDDPDTQSAICLTLLVAAIAVPLNLVFGLSAAWAIAKFEFPGKSVLNALIDLPFSVSPAPRACSARWSTTGISRSSSPCPASCWPPSSSPFPSSPAR